MAGISFNAETELLNRVASNPDCLWRWTEHAQVRMAERGHNAEDVIHALMFGQVLRIDAKEDIVFRVKGQNIDGEAIEVAAAVNERNVTIKVVTVI
jgi:hypothetical protein